ncbi:YbjP/YqhG family protein [Geothrix alkalitolerans]|uniref:YbjP/YqhG family protein n=1 Tax=Geothrix alkalitolerans TaxID=2922724 RepID=UPI001FAF5A96|nr:YbjP/YqhG family protein [Geothrix alkalitolerans]
MLIALPIHAQGGDEQISAKLFVQQFYDWYTPIALKNHGDPAFGIALKRKSQSFSPELALALREDLEAQAKANGVSVGLDGDPFLQSAWPEAHYKVGKATSKGDRYLVNVHRFRAGRMFPDTAAIPEVAKVSGHWVFVNFHSPDGWNILEMLKSLKEKRQMESK